MENKTAEINMSTDEKTLKVCVEGQIIYLLFLYMELTKYLIKKSDKYLLKFAFEVGTSEKEDISFKDMENIMKKMTGL